MVYPGDEYNLPSAETPAPAPVPFDPNVPITPPKAVKKPTSYYDLMLSLSDLGSKERGLKGQMEIANELRNINMPAMRNLGRIHKAAHPLEFANAGLRQGLGAYQRQGVMGQQEELANEIRRRIRTERGDSIAGYTELGQGGGYIPQMGE